LTGTIDLEDDDPSMVAKMIDFLYKTRYDDDRTVEEEDLDDMADQETTSKLGLPSTEAQISTVSDVVSHSRNAVTGPLVTNAKLYILGDKYDIPSLKEVAARKYKDVVKDRWESNAFAESVSLIWEGIIQEEDALKEIMADVAHGHMGQLLGRVEFVSVLRSNADIAVDFLRAVVGKKPKPCKNCSSYSYAVCNYCQNQLQY
jgi:hypothetical protein